MLKTNSNRTPPKHTDPSACTQCSSFTPSSCACDVVSIRLALRQSPSLNTGPNKMDRAYGSFIQCLYQQLPAYVSLWDAYEDASAAATRAGVHHSVTKEPAPHFRSRKTTVSQIQQTMRYSQICACHLVKAWCTKSRYVPS